MASVIETNGFVAVIFKPPSEAFKPTLRQLASRWQHLRVLRRARLIWARSTVCTDIGTLVSGSSARVTETVVGGSVYGFAVSAGVWPRNASGGTHQSAAAAAAHVSHRTDHVIVGGF